MAARDPIVLDVRTPEEYQAEHVEGALNIPVQELPQRLGELGAPGPEVLVYCRSGNRSASAVTLLQRAGHTAENCMDAPGVRARLVRGAGQGGA
jgi:rhodanese-related sulfurtransferase